MNLRPQEKTYFCANIAHCDDARKHKLITKSGSAHCSLCGEALQFARWKTHWHKIGMYVGTLTLAAVASFPIAFPTIHHHVQFKSAKTEVYEEDAIVEIIVQRTQFFEQTQSIQFNTRAGTAIAGQDYTVLSKSVFFQKGQREQIIRVSITPDSDVYERNETFYVSLENVAAQPEHLVVIKEAGVNKDLLEKGHLLVSSLSSLAADLANDLKLLELLSEYLSGQNEPNPVLVNKFNDTSDNIQRAREKYLFLFKDAEELDPNVIENALNSQLEILKKGEFKTQYAATRVMKTQLLEYLSSRITNTPQWLDALRQVTDEDQGSTIPTNAI